MLFQGSTQDENMNQKCPTLVISQVPDDLSDGRHTPELPSVTHLNVRRPSLMDSLSSLVAVAQEGFRKDQEDWKKHSDVLHRKPTKMTGAIPHMSTSLAVICLVLNILAPGTGTVLSGFSLLCCSEPRTLPSHKSSDETLALVCLNVWVGIAQLFTVPFLLVGWLWSITWGVMMVNLSCERKSPAKPQTTIAGMKSPVVFLPSWMSDPVK